MGVRGRIEYLRRVLIEHNRRYHQLDEPAVSDVVYDAWFAELLALEARHPEYQDPNSPSQRVGSPPLAAFEKVRHIVPLLSLNNVFSSEDVEHFVHRVWNYFPDEVPAFFVLPKFDGLAVTLQYEKGLFVLGATRGDGQEGEKHHGKPAYDSPHPFSAFW